MESVEKIKEELKKHINEEKAAFFPGSFKPLKADTVKGTVFWEL